jgi:two-component system, chemotaxis family, protein-glutamate methylesterase/glutaminase
MSLPVNAIPRAAAGVGGRIRVLVVDDSVVIRHLLEQALREDPALECVGAEPHGIAALEKIPVLRPDVVTLDIEMPEMDGIATLRQIRKRYPRLRTIMFSTLTTRGASATFEALSSGADDYVTKAANGGSLDRSLQSLRNDLIPKIKQFFVPPAPVVPAATLPARFPVRTGRPRVLGIGVSTGGPQALAALIPQIPAGFPLPVLIVQHMPPMFTRLLAERLQASSPLQISEAVDGTPVVPGRVYVAPGDYHLRVRRAGPNAWVTALDQAPHENSCRPSVDVLFRSLAESFGGDVLPVVLTGMGKDGLDGVRKLKSEGAPCIVQDEATSVVWGMPGAVASEGLADCVLPLAKIPAELIRRVMGANRGHA